MPRRSPGFRLSESPENYKSNFNKFNQKSKSNRFENSNYKEVFRSVCISNIPYKCPDKKIDDIVKHEFTRFGKYNLQITSYNGERVAYVNFLAPKHARIALESIKNLQIDGKLVNLKPIYHNSHSIRRLSPTRQNQSPVRLSKGNRRSSSSDVSDRSPSPRAKYNDRDDIQESRVLFVGNLSCELTEKDIQSRFDRYGEIIDIELKKSGQGPSFAFIRFPNLDIAINVKHNMENRQIMGRTIKLGFAKMIPTQCVYLSGLGPWLEFEELEREIVRPSRIGIRRINWPRNKAYAYVLCENSGEASKLVDLVRSSSLLKRVKAGYCEMSFYKREVGVESSLSNNEGKRSSSSPMNRRRDDSRDNRYGSRKRQIHQSSAANNSIASGASSPHSHAQSYKQRRIHASSPGNNEGDLNSNNDNNSNLLSPFQVIEKLKSCWTGRICLGDKQQYGVKLFKLRGDTSIVEETLYSHDSQQSMLQHQPRSVSILSTFSLSGSHGNRLLRDISHKLDSLHGRRYCLLLGTAHPLSTTLMDDALRPQRPISKLVEYLCSRNCAGVGLLRQSSTHNNDENHSKYISKGNSAFIVFPPSEFVYGQIGKKCQNFRSWNCRRTSSNELEEFIMVLLIKDIVI